MITLTYTGNPYSAMLPSLIIAVLLISIKTTSKNENTVYVYILMSLPIPRVLATVGSKTPRERSK